MSRPATSTRCSRWPPSWPRRPTRQITRAKGVGDIAADFDADLEAQTLVALVIGLSFATLLGQADRALAIAALDAHLQRLF